MNVEPISEQPKKGCGVVIGLIFGGVFFLAGLIFFYFSALNPILKTQGSSDWAETPCEIVTSAVDVKHDDGGKIYRPRVEFEYTVDNKIHLSETYDFTELNRSQDRCREIVAANPVGMQTSCFFNPDNHEDAVIERKYDFSLFGFIFPLVFSLIGLAIMLGPIFCKGSKSSAISGSTNASTAKPGPGLAVSSYASDGSNLTTTSHPGDIEDIRWDEPQKLKPSQARMTTFLLTLCVGIFWNGIVSFFVYAIVTDGPQGGFAILPLLFITPFILIGFAIAVGALYAFAAIFNPTVELALSTGAIERGGTVDVAWQLAGRTSSVKSLKVTVEGEESATYRRGTDTITATNIFCTIPIAAVTDAQDIEFGSETVAIPGNTMHTFTADRNKISWRIVVHGDIPFWPDIKETYEFRVKP